MYTETNDCYMVDKITLSTASLIRPDERYYSQSENLNSHELFTFRPRPDHLHVSCRTDPSSAKLSLQEAHLLVVAKQPRYH